MEGDPTRCPITLEVMKDPVVDPQGHSYERAAIEEWLKERGTSPMTRKPMSADQLIPNRALKDSIEARAHQAERPVEVPMWEDSATKPSEEVFLGLADRLFFAERKKDGEWKRFSREGVTMLSKLEYAFSGDPAFRKFQRFFFPTFVPAYELSSGMDVAFSRPTRILSLNGCCRSKRGCAPIKWTSARSGSRLVCSVKYGRQVIPIGVKEDPNNPKDVRGYDAYGQTSVTMANVARECMMNWARERRSKFELTPTGNSYILKSKTSDLEVEILLALVDDCGEYWILPKAKCGKSRALGRFNLPNVKNLLVGEFKTLPTRRGLEKFLRVMKAVAKKKFTPLHPSAAVWMAIEAAEDMDKLEWENDLAWFDVFGHVRPGKSFQDRFNDCLTRIETTLGDPKATLLSPLTGRNLLRPLRSREDARKKILQTIKKMKGLTKSGLLRMLCEC